MAEICVVIPGIGGSILAKERRTLWDVANPQFLRMLITRGRSFRHLTLTDPERDVDGVVATGLVHGAMIIPGFWNYGDYRPIIRHLEGYFGSANVFEFPYDWRRSNAITARTLKGFIDTLLQSRASTDVVLVAHSMGGLVARRYLACHNGTDHCRLLITIGTPYQGAAKALTAIAHGVRHVPGRTGARLHALLRSLPSVHELLPTYDCFIDPDGHKRGFASVVPTDIANTGLLQPARDFHTTTTEAITRNLDRLPHTLVIAGQRQPTPTYATITNGTVVLLADDAWEHQIPEVLGRGDSTVPRGSAQPAEWGDDPTRAHVVAGSHVDLTSNTGAHKAILAALEGRKYLKLGGDDDGGFAVKIDDLIPSGVGLHVEAHHADDSLALEVNIATASKPDECTHRLAMIATDDGRYERTIHGLNPGFYRVQVEGVADGEYRTVSQYVTVLPPDIR